MMRYLSDREVNRLYVYTAAYSYKMESEQQKAVLQK